MLQDVFPWTVRWFTGRRTVRNGLRRIDFGAGFFSGEGWVRSPRGRVKQRMAIMRWKQPRKGFTLVELLVVISIIALLIAILLPSLRRARNQAKDTVCRAHMHQLGLAVQYYVQDSNDRLPWIPGRPPSPPTPPTYHSAPFKQYRHILLLWPYLKDIEIYHCPRAKSSSAKGGRPGPRTITADEFVDQQDRPQPAMTQYFAVKTDPMVRDFVQRREFTDVSIQDLQDSSTRLLKDIYTEYWFNDWNDGAGDIPAISGNLVNNIPYPELAVLFAGALPERPRHNGGHHVLFLDTHVEYFAQQRYYDFEAKSYAETQDRDRFGNRPYWSWGLSRGGDDFVDGATGQYTK
jgi:prepilin-type N-terminal cleavage/methylation domain-containing protein/prepilin-type processing-associated H-X9-DG protein